MHVEKIKAGLDKLFPNPRCELEYNTPFQLLVAVVLSAQCTDKRVCQVTRNLFKDYGTPEKLITLSQTELEQIIHSCGFYHNKSKNILALTKVLLEDFGGQVPNDIEKLQLLPGVGRKTANVVIGEAFHDNAIAVDTHVLRTSKRLGLTETNNPDKCERDLRRQFKEQDWSKLHLQLVHFGRYICKSINPKCSECPFADICTKYNM